ncbi:Na+/H+ antiporter subunit E [Streptomyces sp. CHD11]|uniref:Na+/H+ antiporter subunit E n=1 Tax=Streptomyces sp. CHD11 TaxID=2741325 RepID=UPI001BFC92DC|nr:Na+/H+ antiporter subunit E [Streptomyces sp. CHD11]MBT3150223.1 Na+/H+ antiporter subunit E [Streptomyces sp. CHD11]
MTRPASRPRRGRTVLRRLPLIVWLWILWVLLWGSTSALTLVGGLLVVAAVVLPFPLPAVLPGAVPRPLSIGRLAAHLLIDLVRSGLTVAWQVVRHGGRTTSAIIEVPLRVDSDLLVTAVAEVTTVTPGTVVTEIDRGRGLLYVHVLPAHDDRDIAHRRDEVRTVEHRVARAVGHRHHGDAHGPRPGGPDDTPRQSREGER